MARPSRTSPTAFPLSAPQYELRARSRGPGLAEYEIWQLPAPATPHVTRPVRIAGLRGRNLDLVEHRVLRRLARGGVKLLSRTTRERRAYPHLGGLGPLDRSALPLPSTDAAPRPDDCRRGGRGRHGARRSRLLAGHGDAPSEPETGADGATVPADGSGTEVGRCGRTQQATQ